jgi:hypothetical protein
MDAFASDHYEQGRAEKEVGEIREKDPAYRDAEEIVTGLVHQAEPGEEVEENIGVACDDPDDDEHPGEIPGPGPQEDREKGGHGRRRETRHEQYGISGAHHSLSSIGLRAAALDRSFAGELLLGVEKRIEPLLDDVAPFLGAARELGGAQGGQLCAEFDEPRLELGREGIRQCRD